MIAQLSSPTTVRPLQFPTEGKTRPPIFITDCAKAIRAEGGNIHWLGLYDYGFIVRAEFGRTQFRVVLPPIVAGAYPDVPHEPSPVFVVQDLIGLSEWLQAIKPIISPTN